MRGTREARLTHTNQPCGPSGDDFLVVGLDDDQAINAQLRSQRKITRILLSRVLVRRPLVERGRTLIPRDNYLSPASWRMRSSLPFQMGARSGVALAAFWIASLTI